MPLVNVSETSGEIKIPGSIYGRVTVLRNGKTLDVPQAQWLKTLRIEDVERIEVTPNPLGEYRTSHTAVINVVLKRRPDEGAQCSVYADASGIDYTYATVNPHINYSKGRMAVSAGVNLHADEVRNYGDKTYAFTDAGRTVHDVIKDKSSTSFATPYLNMDIMLNRSSELGVRAATFMMNSDERHNAASSTSGPDGATLESSVEHSHHRTPGQIVNVSSNLNYTLRLGERWRVYADADYFRYQPHTRGQMTSAPEQGAATPLDIRQRSSTKSNTLSGLLRLEGEINAKLNIRAGMAYTWLEAEIADRMWSEPTRATDRAERLSFVQRVGRAYAAADFTFSSRLSGSAKIEVLWSRLNGQYAGDAGSYVDYDKAEVDPSFNLYYKPSDVHSLSMSYYRSSDFPRFRDLSPAITVIDSHTYRTGNPELKPSTYQSLSFNYRVYSDYSLSLRYSWSNSDGNEYTLPDGNGNIMIRPDRRGKSRSYSANLYWNHSAFDERLYVRMNLGFDLDKYINSIAGLPKRSRANNWDAMADASYSFGPERLWNVGASYTYRSRRDWPAYTTPEQHIIYFSLSKRFKSSKIRVSAYQSISSNVRTFELSDYSYREYTRDRWTISASFSITFGNSKTKSVRARSTREVGGLYGSSSGN